MKTKDEILEQIYITAEDLMILIPSLKYQRALNYIKEVQEDVKEIKTTLEKTKRRKVKNETEV